MLFFNKNRSSDVEMRLIICRQKLCKYTKMYLYQGQTEAGTEAGATLANLY